MRVLLDTHAFLWMVGDRQRISPVARDVLGARESQVIFSAVVSWEIAAKRAKGKLAFSGSPLAVARKLGLSELPITGEHCEAASELPGHHSDPFDRLLIAQAEIEGLILATRDVAMARYGVRLLKI